MFLFFGIDYEIKEDAEYKKIDLMMCIVIGYGLVYGI